ncbi:MAG: nitroreductase family protein [Armatimonadota bacterium]|nr:MAG: nitroreductase family protein [Armatimonadota bacterium]
MMDLDQAIATRRTIRRFTRRPVPEDDLRSIADAGRLAASAGNRQPVRFLAVSEDDPVTYMFDHVAWLAAAGDPPQGMRPTAYVVILADPEVNRSYTSDCAAAAQNVLLAAHGRGIGGCWIGSVNRDAVRDLLRIPAGLEIYGVIALGYPAEDAVAYDADGAVAVTRDADGVVRVPKRKLGEVLRFERWE